jgi:glycosyltransferase involved in cell wall biosynthesis
MNVLRLARWLSERGNQVLLYGDRHSTLFRTAADSGIMVRPFRSVFKYGDIVNAEHLANYIWEDGIDVLVLHERRDLFLGVLTRFGTRRDLRLLYLQHMHIGVDKHDLYHDWLYQQVDAWIVPLQILKERLLQKTSYPEKKVTIIPFGVERTQFTVNLPERSKAREMLKLPQDRAVIGMVGRLEEEKNQEVLIHAIARLREQGVKAHALILGDETLNEHNRYRDYLENTTRKLGMREYVHFRSFMPATEYAYAAMDIFALTSKSETYGMVTIEAMMSGLPVIGTRHGGTREIIDDEVNGLHVERDRPDELAGAIARLIDNPDLARRLARQAQRDALRKYSHTRQCELFEALIARVCSDIPRKTDSSNREDL